MVNFAYFIKPGIYSITQKTVEPADTAQDYGDGALGNLLATPAYIDLSLKAAVNAVDHLLPEGLITVGHSVEFIHHSPTCLGMNVSVKATVDKLDGNHIHFLIVARDNIGEIGHGRHERVIVDRNLILKKAYERVSANIIS